MVATLQGRKQKRLGESDTSGGNQCGMFWSLARLGAMVFILASVSRITRRLYA